MSPALGIAIMMNNYFHDVATAMLIASAVTLWSLAKNYEHVGSKEAGDLFLRVYASMARMVHYAIAWIVVGGFPRLYFYEDFEWANAAGRNQVPALVVKHVLIVIALGLGIHLWRKLSRQVAELRGRDAARPA